MKGLPNKITEEEATTLYYLLYSHYGNSHICSTDENRFKYNLFSIIWMYGPTWAKNVKIQDELRGLTLEELQQGATSIYNHAYNPSSAPSTQSTEELSYINDQNVSKSKTGKIAAYNNLMILLRTDVTKQFIDKFKKLFITIVSPPPILGYITPGEYVVENDGTLIDESNGIIFGHNYDTFQTETFTEIYPSIDEFLTDWRDQ